MLVDAHNHAFRVLGGVPRRGIYDNMRTAVDKVGRGKERLRHSADDRKHPHLWRDRIYWEADGAGFESEGIERHPGGPRPGKGQSSR
jgi:hypothetical protein